MRASGRAGDLASAAKAAAGAADTKTAKRIPIAAAMLIDAEAGVIRFTASDLNHWITASSACDIIEAGRCAVSAEALARFVAGVGRDVEVSIDTVGAALSIKAGKARCRLPTRAPQDFPSPPAIMAPVELVLDHDLVAHLLGSVAFCVCPDKARDLNGSLLHRDAAGNLACVATEGHWLALATSAITPPAEFPKAGIILPEKAVDTILRLRASEIVFRAGANLLEVRAGNIVITTKLIAGPYPDFRRVIPAASNVTAELERGDLLAALARIGAANAAAARPTSVELSWREGAAAVTLELAGDLAADEVAASTTGTASIKLACDHLTEMIDAIGGEKVKLGFISATQPIRIQPAGASDRLAVLAPRIF